MRKELEGGGGKGWAGWLMGLRSRFSPLKSFFSAKTTAAQRQCKKVLTFGQRRGSEC